MGGKSKNKKGQNREGGRDNKQRKKKDNKSETERERI
jgi:hypothetical protein